MTGYDSYKAGFMRKPDFTREVLYPYAGEPLNKMLRDRGVLVETEAIKAKILSAADGATSYVMENGGAAEILPDKFSGSYVLLTIQPDQMDAYKNYSAPLPFWAWSAG